MLKLSDHGLVPGTIDQEWKGNQTLYTVRRNVRSSVAAGEVSQTAACLWVSTAKSRQGCSQGLKATRGW